MNHTKNASQLHSFHIMTKARENLAVANVTVTASLSYDQIYCKRSKVSLACKSPSFINAVTREILPHPVKHLKRIQASSSITAYTPVALSQAWDAESWYYRHHASAQALDCLDRTMRSLDDDAWSRRTCITVLLQEHQLLQFTKGRKGRRFQPHISLTSFTDSWWWMWGGGSTMQRLVVLAGHRHTVDVNDLGS